MSITRRIPGQPGSAGERLLQDRYGTRPRAEQFYAKQVLDHLNPSIRDFVARQDMMFVATADRRGECDASLRAGPTGFVHVLDEHHLTWPEYRGNGVMASLGNITENAHVGLLFVDFFDDLVGLHVNGAARVVDDARMRLAHPDLPSEVAPGKRAQRWVMVRVEEAYIHCSKHIPRLSRVSRVAGETSAARCKKADYFTAGCVPAPQVLPPVPDVLPVRRSVRSVVLVGALLVLGALRAVRHRPGRMPAYRRRRR